MNTDQMEELLNMLNINALSLLAKLANELKQVKENALVESAKAKFIKVYQDFRKLAPNATGHICWEYDTNSGEWEEQDFNLYEMLDCVIKKEVL